MIIDTLENSNLYVAMHPRFKSAFEFLKRPGIESLPIGRTTLDGDLLYALTQEYETKPVHEGKFEAHRRYIDIQFVLAGEEVMGYAPLDQLISAQPLGRQTLTLSARACLRSSSLMTAICRGGAANNLRM